MNFLIKFIIIILSPFLITSIIIFLEVLFLLIYRRIFKKDLLPKKGSYKKNSWFKRLFIMFPKQKVDDMFNLEDYEFQEYGLHMVCGKQGAGKTITVMFLLDKWKKLYPKTKIITNSGYKYQDKKLDHWKPILNYDNGKQGVIIFLDEIQAWFSSMQSKDFPPEMLSEISQQRKQRKAILGTAQVFSRIAKPIREQTTFIYVPKTFFGCLTIVGITERDFWDNETQKFTKYHKRFWFVHSPVVRDVFDTYEKIQSYKKTGFKSDETRSLMYNNNNDTF